MKSSSKINICGQKMKFLALGTLSYHFWSETRNKINPWEKKNVFHLLKFFSS